MDRLLAIGSTLPAWPTRAPASRDAGSAGNPAWIAAMGENPAAAPEPAQPKDPAADQQRMLHFISHVNAECFISLLQTVDPKPDDYRARVEYRRRYEQLRESLVIPLPPQDGPPVNGTDPLR